LEWLKILTFLSERETLSFNASKIAQNSVVKLEAKLGSEALRLKLGKTNPNPTPTSDLEPSVYSI